MTNQHPLSALSEYCDACQSRLRAGRYGETGCWSPSASFTFPVSNTVSGEMSDEPLALKRSPTTRFRRTFGAVIAIALHAAVCSAQSATVHIGLHPKKSFYLSRGTSFGLFGPTKTIDFEVTLVNEADNVLVVEPGLFREIVWTLAAAGGETVPTAVRWNDEVKCDGTDAPSGCSPDVRIVLAPSNSLKTTVTLVAEAQGIKPGDYRLTMDLKAARARLRELDGSPWKAGVIERGSVALAIRAVSTREERRTFHRLEAGRAMVERDYTTALSEYRQMLALDSADREALAGVGGALLNLRRFPEAIAALEPVEATARGDSLIHLDLAIAYLALGQDDRAEALIRRRLMPSDVVPTLDRLREHASRLTSRR